MVLLRAENVKRAIEEEVSKAGSQLGWARLVGVRRTDVNKVLVGRRLAARAILDAIAMRKVPAYRSQRSGTLLRTADVVALMKAEIALVGSQSNWAREICALQGDINNALNRRRLPVQAILDALGLEKVIAYERANPATDQRDDFSVVVKVRKRAVSARKHR